MQRSTGLKFESVAGCLVVTATGHHAIDYKEDTVKAIAAEIKARSSRAVLVDMRDVQQPYNYIDRYQLGEHAGRYLTAVPVGVLSREQQLDPGRIGEMVANSRGAKVKVFTNEAAALAWLKKYQTG